MNTTAPKYQIVTHLTEAGKYDVLHTIHDIRHGVPMTKAEAEAAIAAMTTPRTRTASTCYSCGRTTRSSDRHCGC